MVQVLSEVVKDNNFLDDQSVDSDADELNAILNYVNGVIQKLQQLLIKDAEKNQTLELQNQCLSCLLVGESIKASLQLLAHLIELRIPDSKCLFLECLNGKLRVLTATDLPKSYLDAIDGIPIGEGIGSCGTAAFRGEVVVVSDISTHPYFANFRNLHREHGLRACWSIPILKRSGHEALGVVSIYHTRSVSPTEEEIKIIQSVAFAAGLAIEKERTKQTINAQIAKERELAEQLRHELYARQKVEKSLRDVIQELNYHINNSPLATIKWDRNLTIVSWSKRAEVMFGWTAAEVVGKNVFDSDFKFIHEDNIRQLFTHVQELVRHNFTITTKYNYRKDGTIIYCEWYSSALLDEEGEIISILSLVQDISLRKEYEDLILMRTEELDRFFSVVPDFLCIVDLDGNIVRVNSQWEKVLGYSYQEIVGSLIMNYVHAEDVVDQQKVLTELRNNKSLHNIVARLRCADGSYRWVEWNASLLGDYVYAAGRDITERLAIERMKNEFVSVVSHEIRTPLTGIRGALGMLASGAYDQNPDKRNRMMQIATNNCDRINNLVKDILALERLNSGKMVLQKTHCDLCEIINRSIEAVIHLAEAAKVNIINQSREQRLYADPGALEQVFVNLLSNAIKFSPPDSNVTIASAPRNNNTVQVTVNDQGRGIPSDKLETIFDPFQQVDPSDARDRGGTGLGLAICKKIVKEHGGKIWADSTLGQGSVFYIVLPLA
ncbi:MAG: PAS domain S-box protein [Pseudanabaenaceae cyanobacterium SKYGB_i_bin29]|nr:PAS domain S-box protein [Pseudanabaenaceae cyanobacterium SKYG29]MDW8421108.1 PAS domain S-box protein [Pseudanabaenaceae cyanobacterium SKYGB_i_bin29]